MPAFRSLTQSGAPGEKQPATKGYSGLGQARRMVCQRRLAEGESAYFVSEIVRCRALSCCNVLSFLMLVVQRHPL